MVVEQHTKSFIIHLHPQMAYICRCITNIIQNESRSDYPAKSIKVYLLCAPSFLAQLNIHCLTYLFKSKLLDQLSLEFPTISFEYIQLNLGNDESDSNLPNNLRKLFVDSVLDSIYRDLTPGYKAFDFYSSSPEGRISIRNTRIKFALRLLNSFVSLFSQIRPVDIYLSHSHYDHYIAPVIAALSSKNIGVNIFHSGYFTSYRLTSYDYTNISPAIALSRLVAPFHSLKDDLEFLSEIKIPRLLGIERTHHHRSNPFSP